MAQSSKEQFVERAEIERTLAEAEASIAAGNRPDMSRFWKAVGALKRNPALVDEFADRVAAIDRAAFESWAFIKLPIGVGTTLAVIDTIIGLGLVLWAYYVDSPWNSILLLVGTAITLVTTHGLAHLITGRLMGMRFTHWFVGTLRRPQPGVKTDYASYLRTPARSRAVMHASGAVVTKTIPFLALGPALVIPVAGWATALLVVIGVAQIVTDVVWSTKVSDWKKVRRELRYVGAGS